MYNFFTFFFLLLNKCAPVKNLEGDNSSIVRVKYYCGTNLHATFQKSKLRAEIYEAINGVPIFRTFFCPRLDSAKLKL